MTQFKFRGNPNLKQVGAVIEWTPNWVLEYKKCAEDPIYFITNYVWVVHVDNGPMVMELRDYQVRYVNALHNNRHTIATAARQQGKSAIAIAYLLWVALFHEAKTIAIVANKAATAKMLMGRLRFAYERLPQWMQQGVVEWQKMGFILENESSINAYPTSSSGIRGSSVSCVYWDEAAFVPNNIAEEFWASIFPTLSSGSQTKMIISSTPIGYNLFWKFWTEANQGTNIFKPLQMHWWETPGRDEAWLEDQRKALGPMKFAQEILCSFEGSTFTLIPNAELSKLVATIPVVDSNGTKIFEHAMKDHSYVMTVDTSRGLGKDYSAAVVYDVTTLPWKVVATYRDKDIAPHEYPDIIYNLATSYNEAFVLIELNDAGGQVADTLYYELEYTNVFLSKEASKRGRFDQLVSESGGKKYVGVRTTSSVKRVGCSSLKGIISAGNLIVNDSSIIQELGVFVQKKNSYAAETGHHDDLAMNLVLFAWLTQQEIFKDLVGVQRKDMFGDGLAETMAGLPVILNNKEPTGFENVKHSRKDAWMFDERLQLGNELAWKDNV